MVFKIDDVDITPYIAFGGLKWQRNDIDAPNSGRTLDGVMHRGRVGTKIRWDVTCRPLTTAEIGIVLNAIQPEYVTLEATDPLHGSYTATFYSNNNPASYLLKKPDGTEYWSEITFPLIEQ